VGLSGLLDSFQLIGLWIIPYILLKIIPFSLHTGGWIFCFPKGPPLSFWKLLLVRRAGGAIEQLTPTATIGGDVVKTLLLERSVLRKQAVAAVVIDKASSGFAKMLYLSMGMVFITQHLPLPTELQLSLSVSIGLILLGFSGFIVFQWRGLLSKFVRCLERWGVWPRLLQRAGKYTRLLDEQLVAYYEHHPWRFVVSLLLHFSAHVSRIFKTWVLLYLLLGKDVPGFTEAVMVTVALAALDQMFFFVPGRVGTLEGARFIVLSSLGISQIYALAFAVIARMEQLVWSGVGMVIYASLVHRDSGIVKAKDPASLPQNQ
jgi:uncharacterized protein (TIRG00374 family)